MAKVTPYKVQVPEDELQKLKSRLACSQFPDELSDRGWTDELDDSAPKYPTGDGVPVADVRRLAKFWRNEFDWRKTESTLNALPTFMASLPNDQFGTLEVYFVHRQSSSKPENAIPLLFIHGWPGSVLEVTKLLPLLDDLERNGGPAFNVVAPSLPNFGWSSAVGKSGFRLEHYADTYNQLMITLGYEQYVVQAGDLGVPISKVIGMRHEQHLRAVHWNLVPAQPPKVTSPIAFASFIIIHMLNLYSRREAEGLERTMSVLKNGWGYHHMHQTKPLTIAYAISDSPVGLLAWIYEKLHDWSDEYPWTDEEVCSWVSMHWFSRNGPGTTLRIYKETSKGDYPVDVPAYLPNIKLGLAYFPKEIIQLPKAWARNLGQVVHMKEHDQGGHFAVWEVPHSVIADLVAMFSKGGPAFGIINGRSGYEQS